MDKTVLVAKTAVEVFSRYRMRLNFAKGKTEAIATFSGPKSSESRTKLQVVQHNKVEFIALGSPYTLRFVDLYKHVGTQVSIGNSCNVEE